MNYDHESRDKILTKAALLLDKNALSWCFPYMFDFTNVLNLVPFKWMLGTA